MIKNMTRYILDGDNLTSVEEMLENLDKAIGQCEKEASEKSENSKA